MRALLQIVLLAAMKLHCHAACLPRGPRRDARALLAAIHGGLEYLARLIQLRVKGARRRCASACKALQNPAKFYTIRSSFLLTGPSTAAWSTSRA